MTTQDSKATSNLTQGNIFETLKRMTIPMILGMILLMSFGLVDTFFVSLLGTDELAAISFTFPVTFTVISLNIGLGIGTSAIIGKLQGQGDIKNARMYATGAIMLSTLMVGVLAIIGYFTVEPIFSLLGATDALLVHISDYMGVWYLSGIFLCIPMVGNSVLRACGDTKTPSIIMAAGGAINAALDPLLIFGLGPIEGMGIKGAAYATLIAWIIGATWIIVLLAHKRKLMLPRLLTLAELRESAASILKIGLPAAGANMLTPIAGAIMTAVVAGYGAESVAAWGVGNRLESMANIVVLALSMTLPPFISQNLGAGRLDRVKDAYMATLKFVIGWQLLVFVLLWLTSPLIAELFAKEQSVAVLIAMFLTIVPLGYGMQGIVILTNSSFNAMHMPMTALVLSVLRLFVFFVPISYAGSYFFGLEGLFIGTVIANLLMAACSFVWFKNAVNQQSTQMSESHS